MKETRIIMGMPVTLVVADRKANEELFEEVFGYFGHVDEKFSTYKETSEISMINSGKIQAADYSDEMKEVFRLSEQTKIETNGYFDILHEGKYDPSGLVKGWAILKAAGKLQQAGMKNFYLDVGGDIQVSGRNPEGNFWSVGIRNPFNQSEIVKALKIKNEGVATSGTYIRGQHIYNPKQSGRINDIVSLTVVGPNIYEADRFATAAFAMGEKGIEFIERTKGLEGYQIDTKGRAVFTSGFGQYVIR